MTTAIAHLTDVEGRWDKLASFAAGNPHVSLRDDGRLDVADGAVFVFGGDAIDRGDGARKIVATLLEAKERQPDRVVLLAGNRDLNKLRLRRELDGNPPRRAPPEIASGPRPALLRWIFSNTMGARDAFAMRAAELGAGVSDDDVVASYVDDLARDGALTRYLARCQLAYRADETLFVHGAVTDESLGVVPGARAAIDRTDEWIASLNGWYAAQLGAFVDGRDASAYESVVAYQAPLAGTRLNQASVVYGRLADATGNPFLPSRAVIDRLARDGIARLVVGHTPSGDAPAILRDGRFELVCADNSYARIESGSRVVVRGPAIEIAGRARLDDGSDASIALALSLDDDASPVGARDERTGHLVASRRDDGTPLLFKALEGFRVEQLAETESAARARPLAPPHRAPFFPETR